MKRVIIATALLSAWFSAATAGTLDTVKQRGTLVCGVSAGFVWQNEGTFQVNRQISDFFCEVEQWKLF